MQVGVLGCMARPTSSEACMQSRLQGQGVLLPYQCSTSAMQYQCNAVPVQCSTSAVQYLCSALPGMYAAQSSQGAALMGW